MYFQSLYSFSHVFIFPPLGWTHGQTLAAAVMSLIQIQAGTAFGFSGVTLPQLTDSATQDLFLEPHEAALFGECDASLTQPQLEL